MVRSAKSWRTERRLLPHFFSHVGAILGLSESKDRLSILVTKGAARISNAQAASNSAMTSVRVAQSRSGQAQDVRLVVDTIPTLAWSAPADGDADFFNQMDFEKEKYDVCH